MVTYSFHLYSRSSHNFSILQDRLDSNVNENETWPMVTDGVAMSSLLGPLMANVFMCHLEEKLSRDGMMPQLYKRYVDDTLAKMPRTEAAAATAFLTTLNENET